MDGVRGVFRWGKKVEVLERGRVVRLMRGRDKRSRIRIKGDRRNKVRIKGDRRSRVRIGGGDRDERGGVRIKEYGRDRGQNRRRH
jgi:hypothetical protein